MRFARSGGLDAFAKLLHSAEEYFGVAAHGGRAVAADQVRDAAGELALAAVTGASRSRPPRTARSKCVPIAGEVAALVRTISLKTGRRAGVFNAWTRTTSSMRRPSVNSCAWRTGGRPLLRGTETPLSRGERRETKGFEGLLGLSVGRFSDRGELSVGSRRLLRLRVRERNTNRTAITGDLQLRSGARGECLFPLASAVSALSARESTSAAGARALRHTHRVFLMDKKQASHLIRTSPRHRAERHA